MGQDLIDVVEASVRAAEEHWRAGRFARALAEYERIIADRLSQVRAGADRFRSVDLMIFDRTSDLATLFGEYSAADQLLEAAQRLANDAGNEIAADTFRLKRVEVALVGPGLSAARPLLAQLEQRTGSFEALVIEAGALRKWESTLPWPINQPAERNVLLGRLYLVLGRLLVGLGQYKDALTVLRRGQEHARSAGPSWPATPTFLLLEAQALLEEGDLPAARTRLAAIVEKYPHPSPGHVVQRAELVGKLNLLEGQLGKAVNSFRDAHRICRHAGFDVAGARAASNLAHILILLNRTRAAKAILATAFRTARTHGDSALQGEIRKLRRLADLRATSLADEAAIARSVTSHWQDDRPRKRERGTPSLVASSHGSDGNCFLSSFENAALAVYIDLAQRRTVLARDRLTELRLVYGSSDSRIVHARLSLLDGMIDYYADHLAEAIAKLDQARAYSRRLGLESDYWQATRLRSWCSAKRGEPFEEQRRLQDEAKASLDRLTGSLNGLDRAVFLLNKWTADEEYLAMRVEALAAEQTAIDSSSGVRRLLATLRHWAGLIDFVRSIDRHKAFTTKRAFSKRADDAHEPALSAQPADRASTSVVNAIVRLWRLGRRTAQLTFLVLPDRVAVVTAWQCGMRIGVSSMTRIELRQLVADFHRNARILAGGPASSASHQRDVRRLEARGAIGRQAMARMKGACVTLADRLQLHRAIETLPKRIEALRLAPDDLLYGLPFAGLQHNDKYLVELYSLTTDFESFPPDPSRSGDARVGAVLLIGDSGARHDMAVLPGVPRELDAVEQAMRRAGIRTLRVDDANRIRNPRAQCVEAATQAPIIHIASHGIFRPDRPDRSGLLLFDGAPDSALLSLRDLRNMDLREVQHVTLSACWTGDHFIVPGRWAVGLPETLWRGGARSILAALWSLNDEFALHVMARFYESVSRGEPRAAALRQIQLACLRGEITVSGVDASSPAHWAALTLYGESDSIALSISSGRSRRQDDRHARHDGEKREHRRTVIPTAGSAGADRPDR